MPLMPVLNDCIEQELSRLSRYQGKSAPAMGGLDALNALFQACVAITPAPQTTR